MSKNLPQLERIVKAHARTQARKHNRFDIFKLAGFIVGFWAVFNLLKFI